MGVKEPERSVVWKGSIGLPSGIGAATMPDVSGDIVVGSSVDNVEGLDRKDSKKDFELVAIVGVEGVRVDCSGKTLVSLVFVLAAEF